jgi:hypothetical protein
MKVKLGDILIVLAIAAAIVLLFVLPSAQRFDTLTAVIIAEDVEVARFDLGSADETKVFDLHEQGVLITAQNGHIAFTSSTCADQTCVNTGTLARAGDIAVCLPNRVVVKIEGVKNSDIDVVAE